MKVGDLVMFWDLTDAEPMIIIEVGYDCATEYGALEEEVIEVALVMSVDQHSWVSFESLVEIDEVINESR